MVVVDDDNDAVAALLDFVERRIVRNRVQCSDISNLFDTRAMLDRFRFFRSLAVLGTLKPKTQSWRGESHWVPGSAANVVAGGCYRHSPEFPVLAAQKVAESLGAIHDAAAFGEAAAESARQRHYDRDSSFSFLFLASFSASVFLALER